MGYENLAAAAHGNSTPTAWQSYLDACADPEGGAEDLWGEGRAATELMIDGNLQQIIDLLCDEAGVPDPRGGPKYYTGPTSKQAAPPADYKTNPADYPKNSTHARSEMAGIRDKLEPAPWSNEPLTKEGKEITDRADNAIMVAMHHADRIREVLPNIQRDVEDGDYADAVQSCFLLIEEDLSALDGGLDIANSVICELEQIAMREVANAGAGK